MVGLEMAARTAGLAASALPTAGVPAEVVPADASPLEGLACASLPCPPTSQHVARFLAVCRTSTLAKRCVSPLWCGAHPVPRGASEHGPRVPMSPNVNTDWRALLPGPAGGDRLRSGTAADHGAGQSAPRPPRPCGHTDA